ncbi:protein XRP2-like [Planococcus citri]|uniref:protein XRP2-like n=1 Tax=Planococcus citri TaxID=170843 RepID=UPI0031F74C35
MFSFTMGGFLSKLKLLQKNKPPALSANSSYSWSNRENTNIDDYLLENVHESERWKLPGSINGQQFIIQNCSNSTIFILDFTNTVTVDDCCHCTLVFGPMKRSIFIRDCADCTIVVACEQFRLRDCKNLKVSLYCATRPIIESSKDISFSCLQLSYTNIKEQFQKCNLNIWNNIWYKIHDYTPANKNDYPNWNFCQEDIQVTSSIPEIEQLDFSTERNRSVIPLTTGSIYKQTNDAYENCFVLFCDDFSAKSFLTLINIRTPNIELIKSRQVNLTVQHAESLFLTSTLIKAIQHGPVIGLHLCGKSVLHISSQIISKNMETTLYYVSPTVNMASHQVNTFFGIADLQMESHS